MIFREKRVSREYEVDFLRKIMQGRLLLPAVVFLIMFLLLFSVGGIFLVTKVKEKTPGIMNVLADNIYAPENSEDTLAFDANLSVNYKYALQRGDEVEVLIKDLNERFYLEGFIKYTDSEVTGNNEEYKKIIVRINKIRNFSGNDYESVKKKISGGSNINVEVFIRSRRLIDLFIGERLRQLAGGFINL